MHNDDASGCDGRRWRRSWLSIFPCLVVVALCFPVNAAQTDHGADHHHHDHLHDGQSPSNGVSDGGVPPGISQGHWDSHDQKNQTEPIESAFKEVAHYCFEVKDCERCGELFAEDAKKVSFMAFEWLMNVTVVPADGEHVDLRQARESARMACEELKRYQDRQLVRLVVEPREFGGDANRAIVLASLIEVPDVSRNISFHEKERLAKQWKKLGQTYEQEINVGKKKIDEEKAHLTEIQKKLSDENEVIAGKKTDFSEQNDDFTKAPKTFLKKFAKNILRKGDKIFKEATGIDEAHLSVGRSAKERLDGVFRFLSHSAAVEALGKNKKHLSAHHHHSQGSHKKSEEDVLVDGRDDSSASLVNARADKEQFMERMRNRVQWVFGSHQSLPVLCEREIAFYIELDQDSRHEPDEEDGGYVATQHHPPSVDPELTAIAKRGPRIKALDTVRALGQSSCMASMASPHTASTSSSVSESESTSSSWEMESYHHSAIGSGALETLLSFWTKMASGYCHGALEFVSSTFRGFSDIFGDGETQKDRGSNQEDKEGRAGFLSSCQHALASGTYMRVQKIYYSANSGVASLHLDNQKRRIAPDDGERSTFGDEAAERELERRHHDEDRASAPRPSTREGKDLGHVESHAKEEDAHHDPSSRIIRIPLEHHEKSNVLSLNATDFVERTEEKIEHSLDVILKVAEEAVANSKELLSKGVHAARDKLKLAVEALMANSSDASHWWHNADILIKHEEKRANEAMDRLEQLFEEGLEKVRRSSRAWADRMEEESKNCSTDDSQDDASEKCVAQLYRQMKEAKHHFLMLARQALESMELRVAEVLATMNDRLERRAQELLEQLLSSGKGAVTPGSDGMITQDLPGSSGSLQNESTSSPLVVLPDSLLPVGDAYLLPLRELLASSDDDDDDKTTDQTRRSFILTHFTVDEKSRKFTAMTSFPSRKTPRPEEHNLEARLLGWPAVGMPAFHDPGFPLEAPERSYGVSAIMSVLIVAPFFALVQCLVMLWKWHVSERLKSRSLEIGDEDEDEELGAYHMAPQSTDDEISGGGPVLRSPLLSACETC